MYSYSIQAQAVQPIIIQISCQATVDLYLSCRQWFKYDGISILFWTDYTNLEPLNVNGKSILTGVDTCFRRALDTIWTTETAIQVQYKNCTNYCIQLMLLYIQVQSIIGLIANQVTVSISFHKVSAAKVIQVKQQCTVRILIMFVLFRVRQYSIKVSFNNIMMSQSNQNHMSSII